MVKDFVLVLMTKNLEKQLSFYIETIGLELIFQEDGVAGLGKSEHLYIVIKYDDSIDSHHMADNKGTHIITFKCEYINLVLDKLDQKGIKIRDRIQVLQINSDYIFIEDADGNEVCLDFNLSQKN